MKRFAALIVLTGLVSFTASPQTSTSTVRGTVRDQTDAAIPAASVSLTNTATTVATNTRTNEAGFYLFPGVVPGPYRLTVEAAGMQKFEVTLQVQVQQAAVVDAAMKVGQATASVEVKDATPILVVDTPTLGHVLERQRIEQLPINGRSVFNLLSTVPGMEGTRAYGLREGSHEIVLDGAAQTDKLWGGQQRRPPSLDTIQEFNVENSNSSARFTRPTTVVMLTRSGTNRFHGALFETHRNNAIGKARRREDYYAKPPQLIRNEFGGSAGGPIWIPKVYDGRNRTFWFFAYEGYRVTSPYTRGVSVPTEAMRKGDFQQLMDAQGRQFKIYDPWTTHSETWNRQQVSYRGQLNVIDPARLNTLAKHLFSVTPLPTHPNTNPLVEANWWGPVPDYRRQWTTTARIDHTFSEKDRIYGRYTQAGDYRFRYPWNTVVTTDGVAGTVVNKAPNKSLAASWNRTFSPTLFSELLVSASREFWTDSTGEPGVKYSDQLGLPNPFGRAGWPGLYDSGLNGYYFETGNPQATAFTYIIADENVTKVRGKHEFQFGAHFRYDQLNYMPDQQHPQGNHNWSSLGTALYDSTSSRVNPLPAPQTGHNMANMFFGVMNYSNQFVRGYFYGRGKEYALYFQDNYRMTSRLTLNFGLRWEYWPVFREKHNVMSSYDPNKRAVVLAQDLGAMYQSGATLPPIVARLESMGMKFITHQEAGLPQTLMESAWKDLGPRLGFAYRAGEGVRSFVVRGGYRISYFPIPLYTWGQRMRMNAPLTARFTNLINDAAQAPDGIPNYGMRSTPTIIAGQNSRGAVALSNPAGLTRGSPLASYFARNQADPRVQDWNLTLEKQFGASTVTRLAYVGNHGSNLEQFYRYNEQTPDYLWFVTTGEKLPTGEYAGVARRPFDKQVFGTIEEYRKSGWSNYHGIQLELERRFGAGYGYQVFYNLGNSLAAGGQGYGGTSVIPELNQFLPGRVPAGIAERNRFLNYQRDTSTPKHRLRWNWIVDLPFGKGKPFVSAAGRGLDRLIGGWQVGGMGWLRSNYFSLPTGTYPTMNKVELYGYEYPVQDCRSGACVPGYLWWNGYIPANQINSYDPSGKPNGVMGVPENYRPAAQPLIPWPKSPDRNDPMYPYFGSNNVWITLKDGTVQRTGYNDGLHPWRQQYLPGVRQWMLDAAVFKTVPVTERIAVRFTADFFNVLNAPGNPNSIGGDGVLNTRTSGQAARELQLGLRVSW